MILVYSGMPDELSSSQVGICKDAGCWGCPGILMQFCLKGERSSTPLNVPSRLHCHAVALVWALLTLLGF
jgi:hypothetical protein